MLRSEAVGIREHGPGEGRDGARRARGGCGGRGHGLLDTPEIYVVRAAKQLAKVELGLGSERAVQEVVCILMAQSAHPCFLNYVVHMNSDRGIDRLGRGFDKRKGVNISTGRLGLEIEIADLSYKNYGKSIVWIDPVFVRKYPSVNNRG
jgi:hypothetical protein